MTWQVSEDARRLLLLVMTRAGKPLEVKQIAAALNKAPTTVMQMLCALRDDGVVRMRPPQKHRGGSLWELTGEPLPQSFKSTDLGTRTLESVRFEHRALAAALRMPSAPPPAINARVVIKDGYQL